MGGMGGEERWHGAVRAGLQEEMRGGGSAPVLVRRLARLGGWSELRTGAALLHFPIQALTLWDFHVLSAFERWRSGAGRHGRAWFDALGSRHARATLSILTAEHPHRPT